MTDWRKTIVLWRSPVAVAVIALVLAAGLVLLVSELRTGGGDDGERAAIAPAGPATATSCPRATPLPAANMAVPSLAYAAPDDTIWMVSADGADNVQLSCDVIGAHSAAWSPTGRYMAHARPDGSLWVLDLETGRDTVLDDATTGRVWYSSDPLLSQFRWSPVTDAILYEKFAVSPRPVPLGIWAATPGGAPIAVAQTSELLGFAWSPDGRRIVYALRSTAPRTPAASRTNQLFLVNADGSGTRKLTDGILGAWSPDGRLFAYWKGDRGGSSTIGDIYIMDVDSGREFSLGEFTSDERPQWSPDRSRHVFYNLAVDPETQSAAPLFDRPSVILDWSPDGNKVAYVEGAAFGPPPRSLVVLDIHSGERTTFHTSNTYTAHAAGSGYYGQWSPDSHYYAFVAIESTSDSSALYVADTQSGEANRILGGLDFGELFVWYSPDGSRLLIQHGYHQSPAIWVANPDGSAPLRLVDGLALKVGGEWAPWRPAGR